MKLKELEKSEQEWKEKNKQWIAAKEKFEKITEGTSGRYHTVRNQLETFYDIIVDIDSLKNMKKGQKVQYNEVGKKHYNIMKNEEKLNVGQQEIEKYQMEPVLKQKEQV